MISEEQAREYESAKSNLIISFIHLWFPRYFLWICKRRYSRYKGVMEYKRSEVLKRLKQIESFHKYY